MAVRSISVLVVAVVAACSSDKSGHDVSCGQGTRLVGSECLPSDAGPAADAPLDARPDSESVATAIGIDPAHDNTQPDDVVASPLTPTWSATFTGAVSYPLVADGLVFLTTSESPPNVRALDLASGATKWGPLALAYRSTLAYDAGRLFVLDFEGNLIALDGTTGTQLWSTHVSTQFFFAPPLATGGVLYLNDEGSGGDVLALDEQTGATLWTLPAGGTSGCAAYANGVLYIDEPCELLALEPSTGMLKWSRTYACTGGGGWAASVYATQIWYRDPTMGSVIVDANGALTGTFSALGIPAFHDGVAFYPTNSGLLAVDIATSTLRWNFVGDGQLCTSPVIAGAGRQIFIGSKSGKVYELDERTGAQRSVHDIGSAVTCRDETDSISLAAGHLLIPAGNTLVVY